MNSTEVAAQLRKPSGVNAAEIASRMNAANANVISACINLLQIQPGDHILELGPGNGSHVKSIIEVADNVQYVGVDWSAEMVNEARIINKRFRELGSVSFREEDAASMSCASHSFNKIFSVNTLYFWQQPQQQLAEIRRVLKPAGIFVLAFGDSEFMRELSFTQGGFTLYNDRDAAALLEGCGFTVQAYRRISEVGTGAMDNGVRKVFHLMSCGA